MIVNISNKFFLAQFKKYKSILMRIRIKITDTGRARLIRMGLIRSST